MVQSLTARLGIGPWAMERAAFQSLKARVASLPLDASLSAFSPSAVASNEVSKPYAVQNGVAVLDVQGTILQSATWLNSMIAQLFGGCITEQLSADFDAALEDGDVNAIVLRVNSPGGEMSGMDAFACQVFEARGTKPIVAHVSGMNCSGGYYFSSACEAIFSDKGSLHGNIGTKCVLENLDGLYEQMGVVETEIVSANAPDKAPDETTPEGLALWQSSIDALGVEFGEAVALYRGLSGPDEVQSKFGNGWVMTSGDALKAGMIDGVCSLDTVLSALAQGKTPAQIVSGLSTNSLLAQASHIMNPILNMILGGKSYTAELTPHEEAASAASVVPAVAALPVLHAGPSDREKQLEAQLLSSHTEQSTSFAQTVVAGFLAGGEAREDAHKAVASLYFNALQGKAVSPDAVKAAFDVLPKTSVGATLLASQLEDAEQASDKPADKPTDKAENAAKAIVKGEKGAVDKSLYENIPRL